MYIRCLDCHSSTWLDRLGSGQQQISCTSCGRDYTLVIPEDLGTSQRDQYQRALAFAEEQGIDLPAAYSVLLKVMTIDEARGLGETAIAPSTKAATARTTATREAVTGRDAELLRSANAIKVPAGWEERTPPDPSERPATEGEAYDPAFREAVLEGYLTPEQAAERGNRRRMAIRLNQMHHLPMKLALRVVDNRTSLQDALGIRYPKHKKQAATESKPEGMTTRQQNAVALGGAAVLVAVTLYGVGLWNALTKEVQAVEKLTTVTEERATNKAEAPAALGIASRPAPPDAGDAIMTDDDGELLSVTGPDPQAVLLSYCESASQANRFEPVELAPTVPPFPGTRLGVFRDFNRLDSLFAIKIRRDSRSRRWKAGDGMQPIIAFRAPDQPSGVTRIPVATR